MKRIWLVMLIVGICIVCANLPGESLTMELVRFIATLPFFFAIVIVPRLTEWIMKEDIYDLNKK